MINKKKISIGLVILGLIAILVLVVFLYHSKQELKQNQASISLGSDLLLKSDIIPFTYKDFLNNDLQKICPFGLSGVAYRDCLVTLLENREKTVDQTYSDIVRDLRAVHEKDMTLFDVYTAILQKRKGTPATDAGMRLKMRRNGKWLEYLTMKDVAVKMGLGVGIPADVIVNLSFPPSALF